MSAASSSDRSNARFAPSIPAGGMASPPHDPPAASPTPLRGQVETNRDSERDSETRQSSPHSAAGERKADDMYSTAYEFGWQSRLQYGRGAATEDFSFEKAEPELEKLWGERQAAQSGRQPWQVARETARDAWNQVYDAIAGDSSAKTKTNG